MHTYTLHGDTTLQYNKVDVYITVAREGGVRGVIWTPPSELPPPPKKNGQIQRDRKIIHA